jgi:cytochrome-b5 reductase
MGEIKEISMSEILKHNKKDNLWVIIHHHGNEFLHISFVQNADNPPVYDVTSYLEDHPGGADALLEVAGQDSTVVFEDVGHSADARETMEKFLVGRVEGTSGEGDDEDQALPLPKPGVERANNDFSTESTVITAGRAALKVALVGSPVLLGYEIYAQTPKIGWLHAQHSGFWKGVLLSSVATFSLIAAGGLYLEKSLGGANKTPYSYPANFKPKVHIAKPITKIKGYLKPEEYQKLPLAQKDKISSNTYRFVFKLPTEKTILGLPIGQHISIRTEINGKPISRSYTPVSNNSDPGELRLVIKIYQDGELTGKYLQNLKVGDLVEIRGPKGAMRYRKGMVKEIGMVAGGTGITPMYQVSPSSTFRQDFLTFAQLIRAICEDPTDTTHVSLLYGNNTESDVLLRSKLDEFATKYPDNFKVYYVLSKPPENWQFGTGFVTKEMVEEKFPYPTEESKALLCGPPGLVNAMKKTLVELGWDKPRAVSSLPDQVFCF